MLDRSSRLEEGYISEKNDLAVMEVSSVNRQTDVESGDSDKDILLPKTKETSDEPAASSKAVFFWLFFWMAK